MSPTDGEQPASGAGRDEGEGAPSGASGELFGELSLTRLRKDDGRALILYAHPERPDK